MSVFSKAKRALKFCRVMENTLITKMKAKPKLRYHSYRSLYTELQTLCWICTFTARIIQVNILHRSWQDEADQTLCLPAFVAYDMRKIVDVCSLLQNTIYFCS